MIDRDSSAEVEYHPPRSNDPRSKKVRIAGTSKSSRHKVTSSQSETANDRKQHSEASREQKPAWNSNVRHKAAPVTQSDRDPTYERRRERRLERQRELMAQAAANERLVPGRFVSREHHSQKLETDEQEAMQTERSRQRRQPSPRTSPSRGQSLGRVTLYTGWVKKIAERIFEYSDIQYTSLTLDKILNSLIYRRLFYVNIYGSYKLSKNSPFFGPPCIIVTK